MTTKVPSKFRVRVPASTSNIGPGFDCLGCGFKLYNTFEFQVGRAPKDSHRIEFTGPERGNLKPLADNLVHAAARFLYEALGRDLPPLSVRADVHVPNARGLGSSATAIVAGLVAANVVAGSPMKRHALLEVACEFEGHPDNVTPSLLGGLTAAIITVSGRVIVARHKPHERIGFVILSPDYEVPTKPARRVLPNQIRREDAIANCSRLPLLIEAIAKGRFQDLAILTEDRLHEPFRMPLYQRFDDLKAVALGAGAASVTLSGAGPSMLAIAPKKSCPNIATQWEAALGDFGLGGKARSLDPDFSGARVTVLES